MGKIPMITVGDTVITEVAASIAWLADAYPAADLAPPLVSPERGTCYRWLFFGGSCFEPAMVDEMLKRPAVANKGAIGWGSFANVLGAIEAGLRPGPYLLGKDFSAAGVYNGAELSRAGHFGAPGIKESRVIGDYVARCTERPANRRTLASG